MAKANGQGGHASDLTTSAAALDVELRRYVELAGAAVRAPLTSEKNLDRAARAVAEATESEKRVLGHVHMLMQAITAAREAQLASSSALNAHLAIVAERRGRLDALLTRFAKLGDVAKALSETLQKIAGYKANPYAEGQAQDMTAAFTQMDEGMDTVARHAQELAADALGTDFEELARQAESLRQQVLAAKNRLSLLHKALGGN